MDNLNKNIGNRISELRKKRGLTQESLAEELNVTVKHISSVERGLSALSLEKLIDISQIFDCTLDYLVIGKEANVENELPKSILEILSSDDGVEKTLLMEYISLYSKLRKKGP
jgi:transcriptional regulator with XRE-family HTH domain